MTVIDPTPSTRPGHSSCKVLAGSLKEAFLTVYRANEDRGPYRIDQASMGRRSLKNICLGYLTELEDEDVRQLCMDQYRTGGNMTDVIAVLANIANNDCPEREHALASFYERGGTIRS